VVFSFWRVVFSFREVYVFAVSAGPVIAFDLRRTGHKRIVDQMEQAPRYPLWTPGAGTPLIRLRVARCTDLKPSGFWRNASLHHHTTREKDQLLPVFRRIMRLLHCGTAFCSSFFQSEKCFSCDELDRRFPRTLLETTEQSWLILQSLVAALAG
jgi:hypothetical protein